MRILSIGNFSNSSWDGSLPDEKHIASALVDLGHIVYEGQREYWAGGARGTGSPDVRLMIDAGLKQDMKCLDFVLIAQWDGFPDNFIEYIRSLTDAKIVYWAFDYQDQNQEWHNRLANEADLYLSKRLADGYKYPNWRWLSQDFAPPFLDKVNATQDGYEVKPIEKDIDVLFTGSYLPWAKDRLEILKAVDEKFNLEIHSIMPDQWTAAGFKNSQGPVMDEGLPALIARAKINLSIDHTIEMGYHSDRVAQILCCGGFVMHRYIPMDEVSFKDNVVYFYNTIDCLDKVQYYLDNEQQRYIIAKKGYLFAQSNMKVTNRVKDLIIIVESILDEKDRINSRADSVSR